MRHHHPLELDQLRNLAPSIFAQEPWGGTSEKYRFFPTVNVIEALIEKGFKPVYAEQSGTRIEGKENFTRHVVRFQHADLMEKAREAIGERSTHLHHVIRDAKLPEVPEIVLMNSHDGTSAYKIMLGFFRLVCANGKRMSLRGVNSVDADTKLNRALWVLTERLGKQVAAA